jgi:type VI protein secretion system component VasK
MRLQDIVGTAFNGATAKLRRDAMLYGLCGLCGLVVIIMAISASVLALEPQVGAIYARLIVAAVFVLIAIVALLIMRQARPAVRFDAQARVQGLDARIDASASARNAQFAQIAMIVEAVLLGWSLSRRSDRR